MTEVMQKIELIIAMDERKAKNEGKIYGTDQRSTYRQLLDLLNIARKLHMQEAVDFLQPIVCKMSGK